MKRLALSLAAGTMLVSTSALAQDQTPAAVTLPAAAAGVSWQGQAAPMQYAAASPRRSQGFSGKHRGGKGKHFGGGKHRGKGKHFGGGKHKGKSKGGHFSHGFGGGFGGGFGWGGYYGGGAPAGNWWVQVYTPPPAPVHPCYAGYGGYGAWGPHSKPYKGSWEHEDGERYDYRYEYRVDGRPGGGHDMDHGDGHDGMDHGDGPPPHWQDGPPPHWQDGPPPPPGMEHGDHAGPPGPPPHWKEHGPPPQHHGDRFAYGYGPYGWCGAVKIVETTVTTEPGKVEKVYIEREVPVKTKLRPKKVIKRCTRKSCD